MSTSKPVNIADREHIAQCAKDIAYYCADHRDIFHRCDCPLESDGVCALHYLYPNDWPIVNGRGEEG